MTALTRFLPYFGLQTSAVLHVGANDGEEVEAYVASGITEGLHVEAIPAVFDKLAENLQPYEGHRAWQAVCSDRTGDEVSFFISNNRGQSSSIFEFGTHSQSHPDVKYEGKISLQTSTLDDVVAEAGGRQWPALVIDAQGAELKILLGGHQTLQSVQMALIEVSDGQVYKGGAQLDDIVGLMRTYGFQVGHMFINHYNWGDVFFLRTPV